MGPIIRMVLEYQYDNYQDTALESLEFIDEYYGNRTSQHVADPHPVSHFLWEPVVPLTTGSATARESKLTRC